MFGEVDIDGNGKVDFEEFLKLVMNKRLNQADDRNLTMFNMFDEDKTGSLTSSEWISVGKVFSLQNDKEFFR